MFKKKHLSACVAVAASMMVGVAHAGEIAVNVSTTSTPNFSTDIFGLGSDTQAVFLPDMTWFPQENIDVSSRLRFNLGGIDGDPALFATNNISVDNYVFNYAGGSGIYGVALTQAGTVDGILGAGGIETADISGGVFSAAELLAVYTAVQASASSNAGVPTVADVTAALTASTLAGVAYDANVTPAIIAADAALIVGQYTGVLVGAGSYTNGDLTAVAGAVFGPAGVFLADGTNVTRFFNTTTSGAAGSYDVTVTINVPVNGNITMTGDSVTLSLNSGKYVDGTGTPVAILTGPFLGTEVDVSNLKVQGFDAPGATLSVYASVQQGGQSRDVANGSNTALVATSHYPLQIAGFTTDADGAVLDVPTTINSSQGDALFSIAGVNPATWYNNAFDAGSAINHIGSFTYNTSNLAVPVSYRTGAATTLATTQISGPLGSAYAITAADSTDMYIQFANLAPFTGTNGVYLSANSDCGTGYSATGGLQNDGVTATSDIAMTVDATSHIASLTNVNLIEAARYSVCVTADGTNSIESQSASVSMTLNNIEPTYQDPSIGPVSMGSWGRNGCAVTFFNVPANGRDQVGSKDVPFLRFTNTTSQTLAGSVRVLAWNQDGSQLGATSAALLDSANDVNTTSAGLVGHQTGIYDADDIKTALGVTSWTGRARVVMFGGFQTCEGQNMLRSSNGTLLNVTGTTAGNVSNSNANAQSGNNSN